MEMAGAPAGWPATTMRIVIRMAVKRFIKTGLPLWDFSHSRYYIR
jgi:hypothetical protein